MCRLVLTAFLVVMVTQCRQLRAAHHHSEQNDLSDLLRLLSKSNHHSSKETKLDKSNLITGKQANVVRYEYSGVAGRVLSPGYSSNTYPNNSTYQYMITVPTNKFVKLVFDQIRIEGSAGCIYDQIAVYDGSSITAAVLARYCADITPPHVVSSGPKILVVFTSDDSVSVGRFAFNWTAVEPGVINRPNPCQKTALLTGHNGTIYSPGFHKNAYPSNATCSWRVTASPGKIIRLRYSAIHVEASSGCEYDSVKLFDGYDQTAPLITTSCGNDPILVKYSTTGQHALILFQSDVDTSPNSPGAFSIDWVEHNKFTYQLNCGDGYVKPPQVRIAGGEDAEPYEYPWQASLRVRLYGDSTSTVCGASIIHPRWLITAAHCLFDKKKRMYPTANLFVTMGEFKLDVDEGTEVSIYVQNVIVHEAYNNAAELFDNDIMLLRLKQDIVFTANILPVCLATDTPTAGTKCIISGWGANSANTEQLTPTLQEAMVPIIDSATCSQRTWYGNLITPNMVCAGFEAGGIDTCRGDSGGPLVCPYDEQNGLWKLVGITSWGTDCGMARKPGVYTKVARYIAWIRSRTNGDVII